MSTPEVAGNEAIVSMVALGCGVGVVPDAVIDHISMGEDTPSGGQTGAKTLRCNQVQKRRLTSVNPRLREEPNSRLTTRLSLEIEEPGAPVARTIYWPILRRP